MDFLFFFYRSSVNLVGAFCAFFVEPPRRVGPFKAAHRGTHGEVQCKRVALKGELCESESLKSAGENQAAGGKKAKELKANAPSADR